MKQCHSFKLNTKSCTYILCLLITLFTVPTYATLTPAPQVWSDGKNAVHQHMLHAQHLDTLYAEHHYPQLWADATNQQRFEFQLTLLDKAQLSDFFAERLALMQTLRNQEKMVEYDLIASDTLITYLHYSNQAPTLGMSWYFGEQIQLKPQSLPLEALASLTSVFDASVAQQSDSLHRLLVSASSNLMNDPAFFQTYAELQQHKKYRLDLYQQQGLKRLGDELRDRDLLIERMAITGVKVNHLSPVMFGQDYQQQASNLSVYDADLVAVVKQFQDIHGLKTDGIIGPNTIKWINMDVDDRIKMLALNAERTRLWPETDSALVLVNVPSFEMAYWFSGEKVFESRVVVGKTERKTPLMVTRLDSVILNPTWNIPWSIMVKDIIPKVKKNRNYLTQKQIEIIPRWGSKRTINPASINWATINPKKFPYKMRQSSGRHNALGLFKFNTPNRQAIYLHDTPSKGLFNRDSRAFSSGCIRVEHPQNFAAALVDTLGSRKQLVTGKRQKYLGANSKVPLRKRIPVHIIYQTAWFEGEQLHYRNDIYDYDNLEGNDSYLLTKNNK